MSQEFADWAHLHLREHTLLPPIYIKLSDHRVTLTLTLTLLLPQLFSVIPVTNIDSRS